MNLPKTELTNEKIDRILFELSLDGIDPDYASTKQKLATLIHQAETKAYQKGFNHGIDQYQDNLINIVRGK